MFLFLQVTVITDIPDQKPPPPSSQQQRKPKRSDPGQPSNYGPGLEARIRQSENVRAGSAMLSVAEGRIRLQENRQQQLARSVDSERNKTTSVGSASNPFEDYDEAKNPFSEGELEDQLDPFKDDYDKNLNPFE